MEIKEILSKFPKDRPPLDAGLEKIYSIEYKKNRSGGSPTSYVSQKLEGWMHKKASQALPTDKAQSNNTLEIGAGTLNQLPYEKSKGNYDFVEPMDFLYKNSPFLSQTRNHFSDISEIPNNYEYDRIISVSVLDHVQDLPKMIKKSIKLLSNDGVFACGISSEGGFLWGLAWRLSTGLEFRIRTGFDYGNLMRHEHVNDAWEIEKLLIHFFQDVKVVRLGFGNHFSLYNYIECRNPKQ